MVAWRDLISLLGTEIKNHQNSYYSNNNHKNFCNVLHSNKSQVLLLPSLGLYAQCLARSNDPIPYKGQGQQAGCCDSRAPILPPLKWRGFTVNFCGCGNYSFQNVSLKWTLWLDFLFLPSSPPPPSLLFLPGNQLAVDTKDNLLLLLNSKASRQRKKQNTNYCSCPFSPSAQRNHLQGLQD